MPQIPQIPEGIWTIDTGTQILSPRAREPESPRAREPESPRAREPESPRAREPEARESGRLSLPNPRPAAA